MTCGDFRERKRRKRLKAFQKVDDRLRCSKIENYKEERRKRIVYELDQINRWRGCGTYIRTCVCVIDESSNEEGFPASDGGGDGS